ncbi:MAG TPA: urea ABC transporter permease subunit UrtC [Chthoniobacterales bacterium]|jgi:urea transport system permease protein
MRIYSKQELTWIIVLAVLAIVVFPSLNAFAPAGSLFHISDFSINLWGKYLTLATLAVSVDLLWGYTGLLSLGQSLFFALGGYAFGMHLMLLIGKLGQYKSDLPDFMVFLGYQKLPALWEPFYNFWFASAAVMWVPGLVALCLGFLTFRSRIKGVYFSILTQAVTYAAYIMFLTNDLGFGGNNGLTDYKFLLGQDLRVGGTQRGLYIASAILLLLTYLGCRWLISTKFGKVQRAIRDSETRVLFSGYAAANYKLFVFVISAMIAGLAGALYVPQVGIINPSEMAPEKSLEAIVWVAVGGRATLFGPIIGAIAVNALKSWATRAYPDYWLIILGGLFIVVVLFMPKGIVGLPGQIKEFLTRRKADDDDVTPTSAVAVPVEEAKP